MAKLTPVVIGRDTGDRNGAVIADGLTFDTPEAGGDTYPNDGRTFLIVRCGGTGTTVSFPPASTTGVRVPGHGAIPYGDEGAGSDKAIEITVPSNEERWIHAPPKMVNSGGLARVNYTSVATVTVQAVRLQTVN